MKSHCVIARPDDEVGVPKQSQNKPFNIIDLGLIDYFAAGKIQLEILDKVKTSISKNSLILTEFYKVFTIGRRGSEGNLLVSPDLLKEAGIDLYNVNRGGDITCHNPGQLVVYPIFNLSYFKKDLDWVLRSFEEVIIRTLLKYKIHGERKSGFTGVWVGEKKIASIGIAVSKWTTYHGLSINVNNDLSIFDLITPCGIKGCKITSMAELNGGPIDMNELKRKVIEQFTAVFTEIASRPLATLGVARNDKEYAYARAAAVA